MQRLGGAVELDEQVQRFAVGEPHDAVAVGDGGAAEQLARGALAVPLAERTASAGGVLGEPGEALVYLELMGELAGGREAERGGVAVPQLLARHAELCGDDVGAGLTQHPVVGGAAMPELKARPEAVEH